MFVAESLPPGESEPGEIGDLSVMRLPLGEAVAMALDGRITDAISVAALLRVAVSGKPG